MSSGKSLRRVNALGEADTLLSPHVIYLSLGATDAGRPAAYRAFVDEVLDPETLKAIRACLQTGPPLGDGRFREQIERALGVKIGRADARRAIRLRLPIERNGGTAVAFRPTRAAAGAKAMYPRLP